MQRERIDPIKPWSAEGNLPSNFLWLGDSYAEAASALCDALTSEEVPRQTMSTRVIFYLCSHAAELYLKGAISAKSGKHPPRTHRLDVLYAEYCRLYPHDDYRFDVPFHSEALQLDEGLFPGTLASFQASHDQRYRYPTDNRGEPFVDPIPFDVHAFADAITKFRQTINILVARIDFGWESFGAP
jgi:hypothetical protein